MEFITDGSNLHLYHFFQSSFLCVRSLISPSSGIKFKPGSDTDALLSKMTTDYPSVPVSSDWEVYPDSTSSENPFESTSNEDNGTICTSFSCYPPDYIIEELEAYIFPTTIEWFLIAAHFIVFLVGLVGNGLVCMAVYRNHTMHSGELIQSSLPFHTHLVIITN